MSCEIYFSILRVVYSDEILKVYTPVSVYSLLLSVVLMEKLDRVYVCHNVVVIVYYKVYAWDFIEKIVV